MDILLVRLVTTISILLDSTTIILFLGIGYLLTFILISAYWRDVIRALTVRTFFLGKLAQSVSWFCVILRGDIPDFLSISIANSLMFVGVSLEIISLLSLRNEWRAGFRKLYLWGIWLGIIGFQLVILIHNEEDLRIVYGSFVLAFLQAPAYRLLRGSSLLMKVIGYFYLFVAAANVFRGATALLTDTSVSFFTPGIYQLIYLLAVYLLTVLSIMAFLLLWKEKINQELLHYASYDDLTGTLNRRMFTANAKASLDRYARKKEAVSYLLFDIDCFKDINDTYGHHVGDLVLKDVTNRIKQQLGENDLFVRYGGDEFGILLPGKNELESSTLAERIKNMLETAPSSLPVSYTVSIGVLTVVPDQHTLLEAMYKRCDQALYNAKRNGRNSIFRSQFSQ
ncbi:diguanylate cyclase (GGDEF) domain-containing protein [Paenibacillus catalpae]|uniref:Diguanylate cyclase (GGDEF) domain-containing protein n=1 Tax=Paenibacillus catalpae TaxID=1045775 RepID=A0A1I2DHD5_9BACL|nr:diguanylate cyclase (GGDEF) domain-containing protein [Paenibacillus catalpae]